MSETITVAAGQSSPPLLAQGLGLVVPAGVTVLGFSITLTGSQSASGGFLTVVPIAGGIPATISLPTITTGSVTIGNDSDLWGFTWTPAELNSGGFGFSIVASNPTNGSITFILTTVTSEAWYTPPSLTGANFDYVKTFEMTDGGVLTLALDNNGIFWQEDVINDPDVLCPFYNNIEPDTFAESCTLDNREFIALSDLNQGTDMPRQYNGQWVDRVSQVGPAVAPTVTFASNGYPIISITQAAPFIGSSDLAAVLWSAGPTLTQAGNTLTFYFNVGTDVILIMVGSNVVLTGFSGSLSGINSTGSPLVPYVVTSVGTAIGLGGFEYPIFTVVAPSTNAIDPTREHGDAGQFGSIQLTLATLTTTVPVPNLQVGVQLTISGATPGTWDGTWTVTTTPNASQLLITSTVLSGNVATYDFTIITGVAPTIGQQVTVSGTVNGDGIFNVANAVITSVSAGSFSIAIVSPDIPGAGEEGNGIVNGTIFQFDPDQVIANDTGGTLEIAGGLGAGIRGAVVMFLTRNGYLTEPGPQTIFTLTQTASQLIVGNLPIGPPNVIARVIAFTGAGGATQSGGGGFYYWIEQPVTVLTNGQEVTYNATIVNDNTSTQVTLNFTDAILLSSTGISIQGNNTFDQVELGSCLGFIPYSDRLFEWGEQNKIPNLLNYSFDGGIGQILPPPGDPSTSTVTYPLGWTIDPVNGSGGSLTTSPLFGNAYYIQNLTGSTQAIYGMITQPAYQDSFNVPIIESATAYSVRVTADIPSGNGNGNLVIDLYSPSLTQIWGSFTIPFASLSGTMQIETGNLLTTVFATVPTDLLIRVYATNIGNGADVLIDRIEPFPTKNPVLTTQMKGSYVENFEAFDINTGVLGAIQNQQPIRNAFTLFDNLYIVKTGSFYSTADNGTTEPQFWNVREVSNKVGTPSIHGVDVGEGWALIVGRAGLYLFAGGDPVKISPELDGNPNGQPGLWESINWTYGNTIWIRNDTDKRKIYIGVPLPTPNQWMPRFPSNPNPTQPNVVLMCNYKELMTSGALESQGPVRLTYTGELKTLALGRKWAAWSIEACYADFITRPDTVGDALGEIFFCGDTNTGKIYQQVAGNWADDGNPMHFDYYTYGFPKTIEAQQEQMGLGLLEAHYMTMQIVGSGNLRMTEYPGSINSNDAQALYPEPLKNPPSHDMEIPINDVGNRFFVEYWLKDAGEWCDLSRVVMWIGPNAWAPVAGSNDA